MAVPSRFGPSQGRGIRWDYMHDFVAATVGEDSEVVRGNGAEEWMQGLAFLLASRGLCGPCPEASFGWLRESRSVLRRSRWWRRSEAGRTPTHAPPTVLPVRPSLETSVRSEFHRRARGRLTRVTMSQRVYRIQPTTRGSPVRQTSAAGCGGDRCCSRPRFYLTVAPFCHLSPKRKQCLRTRLQMGRSGWDLMSRFGDMCG